MADRRLAELLARGQAAAAARMAEQAALPAPPEPALGSPARLEVPERACVETNLARRGFWLAVSGGPRQLALPLDGEDRMGLFTVEPGPAGPLGVTELEVITWLCSRWREIGEPDERRVPLALSQLASDFGWTDGGAHLRRLGRALARLRGATITAEVWSPRETVPTLRSRREFGLLTEWQVGDPDRPGELRRYGWVTLGDWLLEQLRAEHLTWLDFGVLRRLERPVGKRLYAYLEAERFEGAEKRWAIDPPLLTSLGVRAKLARHARATLAEAGAEVAGQVERYPLVAVEARQRGSGWLLRAIRRESR